MTDRLKQISLRRFREDIAVIDEVVEVSRRDSDGNIQILGFWTPYVIAVPGSVALPVKREPLDLGVRIDETNEGMEVKLVQTPKDAAMAVFVGPRAFPKSVQAGRKKR